MHSCKLESFEGHKETTERKLDIYKQENIEVTRRTDGFAQCNDDVISEPQIRLRLTTPILVFLMLEVDGDSRAPPTPARGGDPGSPRLPSRDKRDVISRKLPALLLASCSRQLLFSFCSNPSGVSLHILQTMASDLKGKNILITGAGSGIG